MEPWDAEWWKPSADPIRNLEKAGALLAAGIDRLIALRPAEPDSHQFVGRGDRWCEQCNRPDRHPVHRPKENG